MSIPPNLQKLVITGKNTTDAHPGYSTDARTIEQWANIGIVRKLIAGSNITLTPSDGVDAGNGIEIAASGGGGGTLTYGEFQAGSCPGLSSYPTGWIGLGSSDAGGNFLGPGIGAQSVELLTTPGGFVPDRFYTLGGGFIISGSPVPGGTFCVIQCPFWQAPTFAGGGVTGIFTISAYDLTGLQMATYQSNLIPLTSGGSAQLLTTDFNLTGSRGTDITLGTDSAGFVGLRSNATLQILSAWQCVVDVAPGTTF